MCNKNICRLCLKTPSETVNIFSSDIPFLVETLTSVKVEEDDGLPTLSCQSCISDVRTAYEIRSRIIEADKKLRSYISHSTDQVTEIDIKEEKITEENIDFSSLNTEDIFSSINSDCSDIKDEFSSEEDDTIDNLIRSIEDDDLEDSCEDIEKVTIETKAELEKNVEIEKKIDENSDSSDNERVNDKEERQVSSTGSIKIKDEHLEDMSRDFVIYQEAPDIIHVDTSGDQRKYSCLLCNIELKPRSVYIHKCRHIKAKCNTCGLITRLDNIRRHLLTHKTDTRICDICGSSHKSLEGLRSHRYYFHKKRVLYKCQHCSEEFRNRTHMEVHIRRYHTGDRPYQCDSCGKAFVTSGCLKKHKQLVHQLMRRFPCEYCKKAFSSHGALTIHKRQHTGELPYTCDICHNGFRQLVSLRTHMKSKHDVIMKANKPGITYTNQVKNDLKKQRME